MTAYPKRLIEVDLPIKRISAHARREKSIRHGHISTLHIWWARRPLAACRAVICAALWPDPADELCPPVFRQAAAQVMNGFAQKVMADRKLAETASEPAMGRWNALTKEKLDAADPAHWNVLRFALLDFIADFANWDNSTVPAYLETSRVLTQAAHEALGGLPGTRPLVVDPFAGGGAIPLEALRVGADAFASDLNPVAVLLNKVVLEYIPTYGQRLADEVRQWGQWVKEQAEQELAAFYPPDPDGATPIAYLWARTITCEGPGCGAEVPLMRSLWLAKRRKGSVALRLLPNQAAKRVDFAIIENAQTKDVGEGTVAKGSATCPCCGYTTPVESVRTQLKSRRGGTEDARLIATVITFPNQFGKSYRLPTNGEVDSVKQASRLFEQKTFTQKNGLSRIPNERFTGLEPRRIPLPQYGMDGFGDLFNSRQAFTLMTFGNLVSSIDDQLNEEIKEAIQVCLAITVDRLVDKLSSLARWDNTRENSQGTFGRQALPMVWDFSEANPFSGYGGDWQNALDWVVQVLENNLVLYEENLSGIGQSEKCSATVHPLPDDSIHAFITDPPYYYSVPYSDLSDFFYVWLRRILKNVLPALFGDELTPKDDECVQNLAHSEVAHLQKSRDFYENSMQKALAEGKRYSKPNGIGVVVFAHKDTEAWESLLSALVSAEWYVTASWPVDTEMTNRVLAQRQSTLTSSIHLVCRPRETNEVGDWREVLQELPARIHAWLPRLAQEGVVGADAIFACLGPALEIFSRYGRVEKASGEIISLSEYLETVWAAVSREALNLVFAGADTTGFEADARLTAMWLWTLSRNDELGIRNDEEEEEGEERMVAPVVSAGYVLEYDAARKIAQGLGAHLEQLTHLVEIKGSNGRLLPVRERTRYLFGRDGLKTATRPAKTGVQQLSLLDQLPEAQAREWRLPEETAVTPGQTVLDRVHQAMLLFGDGRSDALKQFLVTDGVGQDAAFWRLAQALSALYPPGSEEKRWVDGVHGRRKGLGF